MKRTLPLLLCAAVALWLSPSGPVEPAGASAQDAPKKVEPAKAVQDAAKKPAAPVSTKKVVLPAAPRAPQKPADADALVQQFEQQYGAQFRLMHKGELHFARVVCQLTKQQYEKIAADSEPALKATVKRFAQNFQGMQVGRVAVEQSDPRAAITEAIAKSVRATLPAEQAAKYQHELDQRAAARKQAVVLNLVAKADKVLVLTVEQRAKLRDVLESNWNESWAEMQMLMHGGRYFPAMPDVKINPILTAPQQAVWRGVHKGVRFGFHPGRFQGIAIEEEEWGEDRAADKPAQAAKGAIEGKNEPRKADKK